MEKEARMAKAVQRVKEKKMSIREAAERFGIPRSTILDHVKERRSYVGSKGITVLSSEEEDALVTHLIVLADMGFGMDRAKIADAVKAYLDGEKKTTRFKDNRPGVDWLQAFVERHKGRLSVRKAEKLTLNRARGINKETIADWYSKLEAKLHELDIMNEPQNIHNADETGLVLESGGKKIICRRGTRNPLLLAGLNEKEMVTVLFAVNAAGAHPPPFVLYRALSKKLMAVSWTRGGPPGTAYGSSPSGWMTEENFFEWLEQVFAPWVTSLNSDKPHLLILDGHSSHISVRVRELAARSGIHLFLLPPHSSHILQPLDVACYAPLKRIWKSVISVWERETMFLKIQKADFPDLLREALSKGALRPANAISGFEKTGICPFNAKKAEDGGKLEPGSTLDLSVSGDDDDMSPQPGPSGLQQVLIDSDSDDAAPVPEKRGRGRPRKVQPPASKPPPLTAAMETQTSSSLTSHSKTTKAVKRVLHTLYAKRTSRGGGRGRGSRGLQLRRVPGRLVFESPILPLADSADSSSTLFDGDWYWLTD